RRCRARRNEPGLRKFEGVPRTRIARGSWSASAPMQTTGRLADEMWRRLVECVQAAIAQLEERLAAFERRITELTLTRARLLQVSQGSMAADELLALNAALLGLAERGSRR